MHISTSKTGGPMVTYWGQSYTSYDNAIKSAVESAQNSLPKATLEWWEVIEYRGGLHKDKGKLKTQFQVAIRIGYIP